MKIIGIDPGLTKTGVGIIEIKNNTYSFVAAQTIYSKASDPFVTRLHHFHTSLVEIIKIYQPDEAAIEETFINKNPTSSLKLGHARGALILTLGLCDLKVAEYSATAVKKSVVGVGRAEKNQIQMMEFLNNNPYTCFPILIFLPHHQNKIKFLSLVFFLKKNQ